MKLTFPLTLMLTCAMWVPGTLGQDPEVETLYGTVRGKSVPLDDGTVIDTYLGIPFAEPPVAALRFTLPNEPAPWTEVFEAYEPGNACVQDPSGIRRFHPQWEKISEDCLNLNIYSPQVASPDNPLPVLVYIFGGDYSYGANFMYIGYFLARKDVVVVTINYRLGILGFGYTGDGVVPGNMGLMDQIQGLHFIQENIQAFGGDPDRVTLHGESAGSTSVAQLMFSPYAQGLFHGAIMQSGCEMAEWATHFPDYDPENFIVDVAGQWGCPLAPTEAMVNCLRLIDAESLVNTGFTCPPGYDCYGFRPVIDGEILPDTYKNLRESGDYIHVPEIIGNNEKDANYQLMYYPDIVRDGVDRAQFDAYLLARAARYSQAWPNSTTTRDISEAFKFYYADWPYYDDPIRNRDKLGDMYTDDWYGFPADLHAKLHSADGNNVYYYIYDYVPEYNDGFPDWVGAYHGLENKFVFGWPQMLMPENEAAYNHSQTTAYREFTVEDFMYSDLMMTLWTNFAKFGDPTPVPVQGPNGTLVSWDDFTGERLSYLNLRPTPEVKQDYRQQTYAFWQQYLRYLIDDEPITGNP